MREHAKRGYKCAHVSDGHTDVLAPSEVGGQGHGSRERERAAFRWHLRAGNINIGPDEADQPPLLRERLGPDRTSVLHPPSACFAQAFYMRVRPA